MNHGIESPEEWRVGNFNEIEELRSEIAELRLQINTIWSMLLSVNISN